MTLVHGLHASFSAYGLNILFGRAVVNNFPIQKVRTGLLYRVDFSRLKKLSIYAQPVCI